MDVLKELKTILGEYVGDEDFIKPETTFREIKEEGALDSVDKVVIIVGMEKIFGIEISEEDMERLTTDGTTIKGICDYIEDKIKQ